MPKKERVKSAHPIVGKGGVFYLNYPVFCCAVDGNTVVTGGGGGGAEYGIENTVEAHEYDPDAGTFLTTARFDSEKRLPTAVRACPGTGLWVVCMNPPAAMEILRLEKTKLEAVLQQNTEDEKRNKELYCAELDQSAQRAATGGKDGVVRIWSIAGLAAAKLMTSFEHVSPEGKTLEVKDLCWTATCTEVCSLAQDKTARVWDVAEGKLLCSIQVPGKLPGGKEAMLDIRACSAFTPEAENKPLLLLGASGMKGPTILSVWDPKAEGGARNVRTVTIDKGTNASLTRLGLNDDHSEIGVGFATGVKNRICTKTWTQTWGSVKPIHDLPPQGVAYVGDACVSVGPDYVAHFALPAGQKGGWGLPLVCLLFALFFLVRLAAPALGADMLGAETSTGMTTSTYTTTGTIPTLHSPEL